MIMNKMPNRGKMIETPPNGECLVIENVMAVQNMPKMTAKAEPIPPKNDGARPGLMLVILRLLLTSIPPHPEQYYAIAGAMSQLARIRGKS